MKKKSLTLWQKLGWKMISTNELDMIIEKLGCIEDGFVLQQAVFYILQSFFIKNRLTISGLAKMLDTLCEEQITHAKEKASRSVIIMNLLMYRMNRLSKVAFNIHEKKLLEKFLAEIPNKNQIEIDFIGKFLNGKVAEVVKPD